MASSDIEKLDQLNEQFWQSILQEAPFGGLRRAGNLAMSGLPVVGRKATGRYKVQKLTKQLYDGWKEFLGSSGSSNSWQGLSDYLTNYANYSATPEQLQALMGQSPVTADDTAVPAPSQPEEPAAARSPAGSRQHARRRATGAPPAAAARDAPIDRQYSRWMEKEPVGKGYKQSPAQQLNNSQANNTAILESPSSFQSGGNFSQSMSVKPDMTMQRSSHGKFSYPMPSMPDLPTHRPSASTPPAPVERRTSPLPSQIAVLQAFGVDPARIAKMTRAEAEQFVIDQGKNTKGSLSRTESIVTKQSILESVPNVKQVLFKVAQKAFSQNLVRQTSTNAPRGGGKGGRGSDNVTQSGNTVDANTYTKVLGMNNVGHDEYNTMKNMVGSSNDLNAWVAQAMKDPAILKAALKVAGAALKSTKHT